MPQRSRIISRSLDHKIILGTFKYSISNNSILALNEVRAQEHLLEKEREGSEERTEGEERRKGGKKRGREEKGHWQNQCSKGAFII